MCPVAGCESPVHARGYCRKHYRRLMKGVDPHDETFSQPRLCHCGKRSVGLDLCRNHYNQWARQRFSEKRTFPFRPWLPATELGRNVVHAQAWYTSGDVTRLGAACNVRISLDPRDVPPESWKPCKVCTKIMRAHGFL